MYLRVLQRCDPVQLYYYCMVGAILTWSVFYALRVFLFLSSSHRTGGIETAGPIRHDDAHHSDGSNVGVTPHPHSHEHNETSLPRAESPIHRALVVSHHGVDPTQEADATNGNSAVSKDSTEQSKLAGNTNHIVPNVLETKKILLKKPAPPPVTPLLRFVWQMCAVCAYTLCGEREMWG